MTSGNRILMPSRHEFHIRPCFFLGGVREKEADLKITFASASLIYSPSPKFSELFRASNQPFLMPVAAMTVPR